MQKYDISVLIFAHKMLCKLEAGVMTPGFFYDKKSFCEIPDNFTADQCNQLFELMWFGGYQIGIFPDETRIKYHSLVGGTIKDPWKYYKGAFKDSPRTAMDAALCVFYTLGRKHFSPFEPEENK